ncbi:methylglyoxal synthase [Salinarchaeum chitinilyticum]
MYRIAFIAHDEEKPALIAFVQRHSDALEDCSLVCTGTTGKRVQEETGLDVERKQSGPLGGDLQIGAEVADESVDAICFFRDPLTAQPHEPDISALLRICDVHDVPLATNEASAQYLLEGLLDL